MALAKAQALISENALVVFRWVGFCLLWCGFDAATVEQSDLVGCCFKESHSCDECVWSLLRMCLHRLRIWPVMRVKFMNPAHCYMPVSFSSFWKKIKDRIEVWGIVNIFFNLGFTLLSTILDTGLISIDSFCSSDGFIWLLGLAWIFHVVCLQQVLLPLLREGEISTGQSWCGSKSCGTRRRKWVTIFPSVWLSDFIAPMQKLLPFGNISTLHLWLCVVVYCALLHGQSRLN